jgi:ATP-dependent DNA helicase RecG
MPTRFAATDELTPDDLRAAELRSLPRPSRLGETVTLPGAAGKALTGLGIETVGDLIEHLPHAHRDRRELRLAGELGIGEEGTVAATVRSVTVKPMRDRRRKRVEARVFDESGPLVAVWFNQPWIARQLGEGAAVLLHGKLRRRGELWVTEHELLGAGEAPVHTVGLVPVHPATEGISAARLRQLVWDHYRAVYDTIEPLPGRLRALERLGEVRGALPGPRGGRARRAPPARVRGALPAPARRGRSQARTARGAPGPTARSAWRGGRRLAQVAPVRAHRGSAARDP